MGRIGGRLRGNRGWKKCLRRLVSAFIWGDFVGFKDTIGGKRGFPTQYYGNVELQAL
jgi:hypothetical protein